MQGGGMQGGGMGGGPPPGPPGSGPSPGGFGGMGNHPHSNSNRRGPPPPLPDNATASLFIEGVPKDATVREISHILRPFDGFKSARLVSKEGRGPLCFAEFADPEAAMGALEVLQGYLIDRDDPDSLSLRLSFAKSE
eukprot:CAMPEP_0197583906 /NCGR_PEP_ID=MMETSP1326-20131121/6677_1 /TAXON_ID=1155430 /ORGANISM="Genus nov. species nov., Strain RCC2288" /LENGTH=136 /DNA_ID=CAMNT_0043148189 /DNA_START=1 /DNA_END=408 /DNA_ORIENTATION=+